MHLAIIYVTNRCLSLYATPIFLFNVTDYSLIRNIYMIPFYEDIRFERAYIEIIDTFKKIFILHTYKISAEFFLNCTY